MDVMKTNVSLSNWPVVGHDWAVELLQPTAVAGDPPQALLITGPPQVGKGTLAKALAQTLLCTQEQPPCGACRACQLVESLTHPDLHWIEPETNSLKISQIRDLTRQLALAPMEGAWQVAVLDQFETATTGAANALLKTLEEPSPSVVLILLAQQAEALLPTIVSRCQGIALRPIPKAVVEQALMQRWHVDAQQARLLSHICGGRLGWAITAATAPALLEQRQQILDDMLQQLKNKRVARFSYAESMARQDQGTILEQLELWSGWWRDLLLLSTQSTVPLTNIDRQDELVQATKLYDTHTIKTVLSALHETADNLPRNVNTRLALEVLLLDLPYLS
jgi:DNA polymerase-3 subunit delta'